MGANIDYHVGIIRQDLDIKFGCTPSGDPIYQHLPRRPNNCNTTYDVLIRYRPLPPPPTAKLEAAAIEVVVGDEAGGDESGQAQRNFVAPENPRG